MATQTLQTFQEFEKYPDDGMKHELVQGEHIVLPPPKSRHSNVQYRLLRILQSYVDEHRLGEVRSENGFRLSVNSWLQPDIAFLRTAQLERTDPENYFEGSPALAIEVASDSNTAAQLDLKIDLYLAHGAEEVWVIYPRTKHVRVHFPDGHSATLSEELRSALFPGWSAPLSAIFNY